VNSTLTSLNLRKNELGEGGAQAISEVLRVNTTLQTQPSLQFAGR